MGEPNQKPLFFSGGVGMGPVNWPQHAGRGPTPGPFPEREGGS